MLKDPVFLCPEHMMGRKIATGIWWSLSELNYNNTIANDNYPCNTHLHFYENENGFVIGEGTIPSPTNTTKFRNGHGLADNLEQILNRYQFLHGMKEQFTIGLSLVEKERYPDLLLSRWGTYIGNHRQKLHEINHDIYLKETDIDSLIFFQIIQIEGQ